MPIVALLKKLPDPRTREGLKSYARFIVARATSITIVTVIHQNVETDELAAHSRAGVLVGSHVLGEMVADATKPFVDRQIDDLADAINEMKNLSAAEEDPIRVESTREEETP